MLERNEGKKDRQNLITTFVPWTFPWTCSSQGDLTPNSASPPVYSGRAPPGPFGVFCPSLSCTLKGSGLHLGGTASKPLLSPLMPVSLVHNKSPEEELCGLLVQDFSGPKSFLPSKPTVSKHWVENSSTNESETADCRQILLSDSATAVHLMVKPAQKWVSEWMSEWVNVPIRPYGNTVGHFGDESFQSITCTSTDNLTRTTKRQNTQIAQRKRGPS